jgi:hypothetical protein
MILGTVPMMTVGAAHSHSYVLQSKTEATCTTEGVATFKCECGDIKTSVTKALNHKYAGSYTVNEETHSRYCDRCKKTIETGHAYEIKVPVDDRIVAPTCTKEGVAVFKCTCNARATKPVAKVNHTFTTLVTNGDVHVGKCSTCNKTVTEAHTWDEGTVTKAAECHADGKKLFRCTAKDCTATKEEAIKAGHDMKEVASKADGNNHVYECQRSGCGYKETKAHNFNVQVVAYSTCKVVGSMVVTCADCNYSEIEVIAKAKHDFGAYANYSADKHVQKCEYCEYESYGDHTWDEGTVTTAATCKVEGVKTLKCTKCKTTKTEKIAKTNDHKVTTWTTVKAATCKEPGSEKGTCTVCNQEQTRAIPVTENHTWGAWEVSKQPSLFSKGEETRKCSVCEKTDTRELEKQEELKGDVNGDNKLSPVDARMILRHVAQLATLSEKEQKVADVTGDGKISATDARKILRIVADLE